MEYCFLHVELDDHLGCMVYNASFTDNVRHQKPLADMHASSKAAPGLRQLAKRLTNRPRLTNLPNGSSRQTHLSVLWQQFFMLTHSQPIIPHRQSIKAAGWVARKETYNA